MIADPVSMMDQDRGFCMEISEEKPLNRSIKVSSNNTFVTENWIVIKSLYHQYHVAPIKKEEGKVMLFELSQLSVLQSFRKPYKWMLMTPHSLQVIEEIRHIDIIMVYAFIN